MGSSQSEEKDFFLYKELKIFKSCTFCNKIRFRNTIISVMEEDVFNFDQMVTLLLIQPDNDGHYYFSSHVCDECRNDKRSQPSLNYNCIDLKLLFD